MSDAPQDESPELDTTEYWDALEEAKGMFEKTEEQKELAERQASEDKHLQQRQEDELNEKLESLVKAEQAFWEGHENDSEEQKKQYEGEPAADSRERTAEAR